MTITENAVLKALLNLFAFAAVITCGTLFGQQQNLADQIMDSDEKQFAEFFPRGLIFENIVRRVERVLPSLLNEIDLKLPTGASIESKEKLARRQANAAVVLLKLNQQDRVWPLFKHSLDPTARSYLIHRMGPLGVDAITIIEHLNHETDVTICSSLILSLGEFEEDSLLPKDRNAFLQKLKHIYSNDADSGLHASVEWLLRKWNQEDWLRQVNEAWAQEKESLPRQWYVTGQAQTMVVISAPVEFLMGSPATESDRKRDEAQHHTRIDRSFAIASKEVTADEFLRFRKYHFHIEYHSPNKACPVNNVTWYEAAGYCNWLNEQEGIPRDQWCYAPNKDGEYKAGMKIVSHHLKRTGYRLPTETEWEYACRAGTETRNCSGESEELLAKYAWIRDGMYPGVSHPGGKLKPNDLGLFDMHGNIREWCHDSYGPYAEGKTTEGIVNPGQETTIDDKNGRVLRGGSFVDSWWQVRSSYRDHFSPRYCETTTGFRLARTISSAPSAPKNGKAEHTVK